MNRRILVIEDDQGCESILRRVIHSLDSDAKVDWEESVENAVDALQRQHAQGHDYDLIIADIFLSGRKTGLELWQSYRDNYPDIPMLIVSSLSPDRFFSSIGAETIAPPFLPKPFHAGECKQMIEGLLAYN